MPEGARRAEPLDFDAFIGWREGHDERAELLDGQIVAMASADEVHGELAMRFGALLTSRLREPCRAISECAVRIPHDSRRAYVPDITVTCAPRGPRKGYIEQPHTIVEIHSPSNTLLDKERRLEDFFRLPGLETIIFIWSSSRRLEVWRRNEEDWQPQLLGRGAALDLGCCAEPIAIDEIYGQIKL